MKKQTILVEPYGEIDVLTRTRARSIRLVVSNGVLRVTKPAGVPLYAVGTMVRKNSKWIDKRLEASKEKALIHDGDIIGPELAVRFITSKNPNDDITVKRSMVAVIVNLPTSRDFAETEVQALLLGELFKVWRELAKAYIPGRLDELAEMYGFSYKELRLKKIKSRWGSCSSKGNININIQLIKLDDELIDHVLLHELSHTKALNHGPDFWQVFESVRPNAREERKQLKQMTIF